MDLLKEAIDQYVTIEAWEENKYHAVFLITDSGVEYIDIGQYIDGCMCSIKYVCERCGWKTKSYEDMVDHMKEHLKDSQFRKNLKEKIKNDEPLV